MNDSNADIEIFKDLAKPLEERLLAGRNLVQTQSESKERIADFNAFRAMVDRFILKNELNEIAFVAIEYFKCMPEFLLSGLASDKLAVRNAARAAMLEVGFVKEKRDVNLANLAKDIELVSNALNLPDFDESVPGSVVVTNALLNLGQNYNDSPQALEILARCMSEGNVVIRRRALWAIGRIGNLEMISAALCDADEEVRIGAAGWFGECGDDATLEQVDKLRHAFENDTRFVSREAKKSLLRLGVLPARELKPSRAKPSPDVLKLNQTYDWPTLLSRISVQMLGDNSYASKLPKKVIDSGWLGKKGASESALVKLETRLGRRLPTSYREFLSESNGFDRIDSAILKLYSASEVTILRSEYIEWLSYDDGNSKDVTIEDHCVYGAEQSPHLYRAEYLRNAIEVSALGDAALIFLCPEVISESGEWEAWYCATWIPGARRYRSFWDLMQDVCLRNEEYR